jgi:transposase
MTVYCGVDFHARVQTVCWCDLSDGEIHVRELHHLKDDIGGFYAQFGGEVIVGMEASGFSRWFEEMLQRQGHQVWLGDAAEIRRQARRRQKNDRRDAELILDLLMGGGFPRVYPPAPESLEVLRMLRYRHRLVRMQTMVKNSLHAIAINAGLPLRTRLLTKAGRQRLRTARLTGVMAQQREEWLSLLEELERRVSPVDDWLHQRAEADARAVQLRTHPGIGPLTSLGLVHTLEPVARFANARKVVAYVGLEPTEHSSAERKRYGGISKAGSRLLRFLLGEAGYHAARQDAQLKGFYQRLVHRHGPQKAKVAVARKLLVRGYIMLRDQIDYAEFHRRGVEVRPARQPSRPENA